MANYRLTQEEADQLQAQEGQINELGAAIQAYKRAGLDATALERSLNRIKTVRAGMLKHLAPSVPKAQP